MILKVIAGGVVVFLAVWAWKIHIYLKRQKRKERDEAPFHRWADEVHQRPGQKEKLRQAKEEDISVHFESEKKCFARMKAPDDQEEVWCGLGMCQCGTFKADHLPCKHIYKLALIKGLIQ